MCSVHMWTEVISVIQVKWIPTAQMKHFPSPLPLKQHSNHASYRQRYFLRLMIGQMPLRKPTTMRELLPPPEFTILPEGQTLPPPQKKPHDAA